MTSIKEYLKLLGKGILNLDKIVEGFINKADFKNLPEEDQKIIIDRSAICASCPYNSENAKTSQEYFDLFGTHYKTTRKTPHCSLCGCGLAAKVSCLSCNCGIESYNNTHKNNKIELKWKKVK